MYTMCVDALHTIKEGFKMKLNKILITGLTITLGAATGVSVIAASSQKNDMEGDISYDMKVSEVDGTFTVPDGAIMLEKEIMDNTENEDEISQNDTSAKDGSIDAKLTMPSDNEMSDIPIDAIPLDKK